MNVPLFTCSRCHDMGYVCINCDQPDGECLCVDGEEPDLIRCDECDGHSKHSEDEL